ncbi:MAG: hypothetical protein ACLFWG_10345, partial [Longimicrobiales bacterium]
MEVQDAEGNVVTTSTASVEVAITSGEGGTLGGPTTVDAADGVAAYEDLTLAGTVGEKELLGIELLL